MATAGEPRLKKKATAALLGLSGLWALSGVRADLLPNLFPAGQGRSEFAGQAATLALFALVAGAMCVLRGPYKPDRVLVVRAALVGLGLFFLPGLVFHFARTQVSDFTRVTLVALVPVLVVVLEPHIGRRVVGIGSTQLVASLAALAGTLCVFPFDLPSDFASALALGAVVVAVFSIASVNCWASEILREGDRKEVWLFAGIAAGTSAIAFAVAGLLAREPLTAPLHAAPGLLWTVLVDVPALGLLFYVLRALPAVATATRFLFAPLIANLISIALLRPHVDVRAGLGLAMIAAGAGWLLLAPAQSVDFQTISSAR